MQPWKVEVGLFLAEHFWLGCGIVCYCALAFYRLWARTRYFAEAWERQERVSYSRESALVERATDRLLKAFFESPPPTLQSLANDSETPWSLTPSTGSFPKPGGKS